MLKYWIGVQQGQSYPWWGASLALVGHPSSGSVMIKVSYGVTVLHQPALHPIFSYWGLGFVLRLVETSLGRWTLVVAVLCFDTYTFLVFSDLTCHHEDTGIGVFWLHCVAW